MTYYKYLLPFRPLHIADSHFVYLGKEVITPAEYDEEGNVITEAVYGNRHKVDVLWKNGRNEDWDEYIVKPTTHEHWFMGKQSLWDKSNK